MSDNLLTKLANPAPLGLLGFGITTVLLNLVNAGVFPLDTVILAMGIAYGGISTGYRWHNGVQKRQHIWHSRIPVLRLVLVESCFASGFTKIH